MNEARTDLEHAPGESVFVKALGDDRVIAIGLPMALDVLGRTIETVPEVFLRTMRRAAAAAPELQQAGDLLSGRVVELTRESAKLLRAYKPVVKDGAILGVVRNSKGQFSGVLSFTAADGTLRTLAPILPGVAGAIGMQLALADVERRLQVLQADVGYLIEHEHLEVEAGIDATLAVLADVYAATWRRGEVDDDEWDRAVSTELPIRELHALTTKHLRSLRQLLDDDERALALRVRRLSAALRSARTAAWLQMHVHAEIALARWELVYLARQADRQPEELASMVEQTTADFGDRREELQRLADEIAEYLVRGDQLTNWLDRLRVVSRYRMSSLLHELDDVLRAFTGELIYVDHAGRESLPTGPTNWQLVMRRVPRVPAAARRTAENVASTATKLIDRGGRSR